MSPESHFFPFSSTSAATIFYFKSKYKTVLKKLNSAFFQTPSSIPIKEDIRMQENIPIQFRIGVFPNIWD